jgi:hypothetical protein
MDKRILYFMYDMCTNFDKFYQMTFEQGERLWEPQTFISTVLLPSLAEFWKRWRCLELEYISASKSKPLRTAQFNYFYPMKTRCQVPTVQMK